MLRVGAMLLLAAAATGAQQEAENPEIEPHRRKSTIYVTDRASGEVKALSRDSAELLATIPVGKNPMGIAARRDGDRIYVASAGSHAIHVIDGASRKVLDTIALAHGTAPAHLALSPDERVLYVAASGRDAVIALGTGSLQEIAEIPVGRMPARLAVSPDGRRVYALCTESGRVDVVDPVRAAVVGSISIGAQPSDIGVDPRTGIAFVSRSGAPLLHSVLEGATQSEETGIEAPAVALAVDGDGRRVYLASPLIGRILAVAPGTGAPMKVFDVEGTSRIALDPEGRNLYSLSARRGVLTYVNRIVGTVEREVPVGKEPWDLVLIP